MDPYLGEMRTFPWSFAPKGWAFCQGQLLPINQNQALFSLLGVAYGGDGINNFALPDLRGRTPIGFGSNGGQNYGIGQKGGAETVFLTASTLAAHSHSVNALTAPGNIPNPTNGLPATVGTAASVGATVSIYAPSNSGTQVVLATDTVSSIGGSVPHNNVQPSLVLNICIAIQGIFPSRN